MNEFKTDIAYVLQYLCYDWYKVKLIKNKTGVCIRGKGNTFLFSTSPTWFYLTQERRDPEALIKYEENKLRSVTSLLLYYKILSYGK